MHKILIVDQALEEASEEARCWKAREKEAGGSLIGIQQGNTSVILYALRTGPNANQAWGHVMTDVAYQNACLNTIIPFYRASGILMTYLVDWHLHPMFLPHLSSTDDVACKEILRDHSYLQGLPLILITFQGEELIHVPFWITDNGKLRKQKAKLEIVAPDDKRIRTALKGHPYVSLQQLLSHCHAGYEQRVQMEINELQNALGVQPIRYDQDGITTLSLTTEELNIIAALPPEYPLNPPTILLQHGKEYEVVRSQCAWNSFSRIADIIRNVAGSTS